MRAKYEIKAEYLGPAAHHKKEIRVLNRTLRWTSGGITYEPDQRHAELIVKEMGMEGAKPAPTPGVPETKDEVRMYDQSPELSKADSTAFRGLAARLNYLALDRPDLQFAAKEVSKKMARPREADWSKLKRVAKYLVGAPRLVQHFEWQVAPMVLHTFTDSDWAGDRESRKSTSGGAISWGRHTLKTWSTTQSVIALSSGEAELYALVKGAAQSYGIMAMLFDFGHEIGCTVCTDASAAIGIVHRQGLGKTRHIEVQYLWVQQDVQSGKLQVVKVGTDSNPADLMTKHLKEEVVKAHLEWLGYSTKAGRAASAPGIQSCGSKQDDQWASACQLDGLARLHQKARRAMFTPMKVAKGPVNAQAVGDWRVTIGEFVSGGSFCKVDEWKTMNEPHEQLPRPWKGTTYFVSSVGTRKETRGEEDTFNKYESKEPPSTRKETRGEEDTFDKYESEEPPSTHAGRRSPSIAVDRCESEESTFDYSGSVRPGKKPEADAWAKEYPAWPLPGMPVPKTAFEPKRTRWADEEPLDAVAA